MDTVGWYQYGHALRAAQFRCYVTCWTRTARTFLLLLVLVPPDRAVFAHAILVARLSFGTCRTESCSVFVRARSVRASCAHGTVRLLRIPPARTRSAALVGGHLVTAGQAHAARRASAQGDTALSAWFTRAVAGRSARVRVCRAQLAGDLPRLIGKRSWIAGQAGRLGLL